MAVLKFQHFKANDSILYDSLLRKDENAYLFLYEELYNSFAFWVSKNNGSDFDAEDCFQKGLLNFLLNLETGKYQYQPTTKVTTVVFEYCKRVWLTELQSARLRTRSQLVENFDYADNIDIQESLEQTEIITAVETALNQIKGDCQKVLRWFYIEELSIREIAEKLGMKESSTKSKRYDCTEKLKEIYLKVKK